MRSFGIDAVTALHLPATGDDGRWCVWFLDAGSRSWARFDYRPETRRWLVHQFGPRRLWDEITAAHQKWDQLGRPPVTQWRFTVTLDEQRVELTGTIGRSRTRPAHARPAQIDQA
ncbi:MAG: hypothetical protein ACRDRA_09025 [Pseudonocardiaceae bacterium]